MIQGVATQNLSITQAQFGTDDAVSEDESNTALGTPVGTLRAVDNKTRANKTVTLSWFFVKGTFSSITLKEFGAFFADNVLAVRDTASTAFDIANADQFDIRVDVTIEVEQ